MSHCLPDEVVIGEILWRLPLDLIIRCRCVCKSWYSLITSRNFISTHLLKTKNNNTQIFMYQCKLPSPNNAYKPDDDHPGNQISLLFHNRYNKLDHRLIHLPTDPFFTFTLIGCFNGILCFVDVQYLSRFFLSNPSIRRSLSLPIPQFVPLYETPLMGFGFDHTNDDYKIVRILKISNHWAAEVYSLNSNCWSPVDDIAYNFRIPYKHGAAFANRGLHWIVRDCDANDNTNFILVFDLKDETFHRISLPKRLANPKRKGLDVRPYGESSIKVIHLAPDGGFHGSWAMKEYGAAESWNRVTGDEAVENFVPSGFTGLSIEFVDNIDKAKHNDMFVGLRAYVPTLLLLDKQNNVDDATPTKRIKL